jgi:predicted O-methyltransferase YrrM
MGQIVPHAVERYLADLNQEADPVLRAIEQQGSEQNLPIVDAEVGALLRLLATTIRAQRVLEIGTAIGYSGVWLAGALPADGMFVTLEIEPARARAARENFARAGLSQHASVIIGDAQRTLTKIAGPFDLIFQDGDKQQYSPLLSRLIELLRPGGLLVTDNVLWGGDVVPAFSSKKNSEAPDARAIAEYNRQISRHPRLMTVIVPLRDGVAISVKRE